MIEHKIGVFYSYSHKDEDLRNELEKHLTMLRRGMVAGWYDRKIGPGTPWNDEIRDQLDKARIILLLVSPDFLASGYCWDIEMKRAMDRHKSGQARVIPIILRPVHWEDGELGKLQALPRDNKPITVWANRDEAFANVAKEISRAVKQLLLGPCPVDMARIPAGAFYMGTKKTEIEPLFEEAKKQYSDEEDQVQRKWFEVETPRHRVYVDEFYLDKHPVTNACYRKFVEQTGHPAPIGFKEVDGKWKYDFKPWEHPGFNDDDQPVVCVNWHDAMAYAKWAGKRLPTEAEWEKAARGGLVGKKYPWGNEPPTSEHCNFSAGHKGHNLVNTKIQKAHRFTTPKATYPANGYKLWDMAGNVWEWCLDEYDADCYRRGSGESPRLSGELNFTDARHIRDFLLNLKTPRVIRGGSWYGEPSSLRVARRNSYLPASADNYIGFRCARSSPDSTF